MNNARTSTYVQARLALLAATTLALSAQAGLAQAACKTCGTVTEVRAVTQKGEGGSGLGIAAGAVVGGLLGNQVGKGTGNTIATVGGAVAGGFAGNEVEKHVNKNTVFKTAIRMDDGRVVNYTLRTQYAVGAKVTVADGKVRARKP
jgi:outer membrane lipoprotein SlyB